MIMSAKPALRQLIANLYRDEGRREGLTNGDMPIRNFVHDYSIDGYGEPDGNGFDYTATLEGNIVTVEITEQMTAVAGRVPCKIEIEKNSTKRIAR